MSSPICPKCRQMIPEGKLSCPGCVNRQSRIAVEGLQADPLRRVRDGDGQLIVRAIEGQRHVQMFQCEPAQTFCGLKLQGGHKKSYADYYAVMETGPICASCRIEVKRLTGESHAVPAA